METLCLLPTLARSFPTAWHAAVPLIGLIFPHHSHSLHLSTLLLILLLPRLQVCLGVS